VVGRTTKALPFKCPRCIRPIRLRVFGSLATRQISDIAAIITQSGECNSCIVRPSTRTRMRGSTFRRELAGRSHSKRLGVDLSETADGVW
jgi:hypothetical protein